MKATLEPIRLVSAETSLHVYRRDDPEFEFNWHYHPEYELTAIIRGQGTRTVGNHLDRFGPGDLALIGSNLPHVWVSDEEDYGKPHRALVIQFPHELLAANLQLPEYRQVRELLQRSRRGLHFPSPGEELMNELMTIDSMAGLARLLALTHVLDKLSFADSKALASDSYAAPMDRADEERLQRALAYIQKHAHGRITLADVAAEACLSEHSFSRYFKQRQGKRFSDYVTELRLGWVCRALIESELPIGEAAMQSGFRNLSNFNHLFKREYGMTPRTYRNRFHKRA